MTLWLKPIDSITFQDIDLFCQAGWEESVRLDYKGDFPKDTAKTMAAMANTVGGMIILGIDADKTTNKPIWPPQPLVPPQTGLPTAPGHAERVYQYARDSIFPPLMVEVSPVIDNAHMPGQSIIVIRIPQSKEAPHATDSKKHVYLYERTGNQNYAHHHADIDYIEQLFKQRQLNEDRREQMIHAAIAKGVERIRPHTAMCMRWISVIPYYPWRNLATPQQCYNFHNNVWRMQALTQGQITPTVHRSPGGSFGMSQDHMNHVIACSSVSQKGHLFDINAAAPTSYTADQISYAFTESHLAAVLAGAKAFYTSRANEAPSYLVVTLGLLDANGRDLIRKDGFGFAVQSTSPFSEKDFRGETTLLGLEASPKDIAEPILKQLCFEFNCP